MSEKKRFILAEDSNGLYSIFDTEDKEDNRIDGRFRKNSAKHQGDVVRMSEKRFELLDETIFDNQKQAEDGGRVTYWVVEYQQRQELVELLNSQNREINILKQKIDILREEIQSTVYILKMQTRKLEGY